MLHKSDDFSVNVRKTVSENSHKSKFRSLRPEYDWTAEVVEFWNSLQYHVQWVERLQLVNLRVCFSLKSHYQTVLFIIYNFEDFDVEDFLTAFDLSLYFATPVLPNSWSPQLS